MKKFLSLIIFTFLLPLVVFSNYQRVISIKDDAYSTLEFESIIRGKVPASNTYPYSAEEYNKMARRLDNFNLLSSYDTTDKGVAFNFNLTPALQLFLNTNSEFGYYENKGPNKFRVRPLDVVLNVWDYKPLIDFHMNVSFADLADLHLNIPLSLVNEPLFIRETITKGEKLFNPLITTNTLTHPYTYKDFSLNPIGRNYIAFGSDSWALAFGKDRLNWGPGFTGNFIISDSLPYHDHIRISYFSDTFKYIFLVSFFQHPDNYNKASQAQFLDGSMYLIAHRVEALFANDSVKLSITEANIFQYKDGRLDFTVISPTTIFHNYYNRGNSNSIASLELEYTFLKHFNIYTQFVVDEFAIFGEPRENQVFPDALGFMLGFKSAYHINDGLFYAQMEGVYTYPYLYLRDVNYQSSNDAKKLSPQLGFIARERQFVTSYGISWTARFIGYKYGGDAGVFAIKAGYKKNDWRIEGKFTYILHGTHDVYTQWGLVDNAAYASLSTTHPTYNQSETQVPSDRNAISHTINLELSAQKEFIDNFYADFTINWIGSINKDNIKSSALANNLILSISLSYSYDF